jgi:hypothetical protein
VHATGAKTAPYDLLTRTEDAELTAAIEAALGG